MRYEEKDAIYHLYEFDGCELTLDKNDRVIGVTRFYSRIVIG